MAVHAAPPISTVISGPMWLGPLHSEPDLAAMHQAAALTSDRWTDCRVLIDMMRAESAMPPYYYSLAEIGRRGKTDIPPRQVLIELATSAGIHRDPHPSQRRGD